MNKEAVFFSASSCSGPLLHRRRDFCLGSARAWMRSVRGVEALSNLATRSSDSNPSKLLKEARSQPLTGFTVKKYPLPKHEHPRKLFWVGQLSVLSSRQNRVRKSSVDRTVRVEVAGLDYRSFSDNEQAGCTTEGPSCIYVGPLEKAEKARLEALYQQARDSYYSGRPLVVDDMFDRVETMLRWHGSKLVMKYPRCSLKRYSAYSDAEIDSSQMWALASIWGVLLASGIVAAAGPPACAISKACQNFVHLRFESHGVSAASETVMYLNGLLAVIMGLAFGIPVALAAASSLQGLWRGDLVAMKGSCPSCGEEVYAFVRADQSGQPQHKTECHVCEHPLMFRANVEVLTLPTPSYPSSNYCRFTCMDAILMRVVIDYGLPVSWITNMSFDMTLQNNISSTLSYII